MPHFVVKKEMLYTQDVRIQAADRESARKMAVAGYGYTMGEPELHKVLNTPRDMAKWEVLRFIPLEATDG